MIILDAHCDTLSKILDLQADLYENTGHVDIARIKKYDGFVQFFASFVDPAYGQAYAMRRALKIIDEAYRQFEKHKDVIMLCCNYKDIKSALNTGKVAAILSLEGGDALQGELSSLRILYRLGIRSVTLTWNYRNEIADGVLDASSGGGLTSFGKNVVKEMNALGMLVDVSHISERGFWDVLELSTAPVIASHSNARSVCDSPRNLTDNQMKGLFSKGGVMGLNLYPAFLNQSNKASVKDIIKHIEHICSLGGYDNIGLGCDFDGIESTPQDIKGVEDIGLIFDELLKLNYSEDFIRKLAGENFLRVIKQVLV